MTKYVIGTAVAAGAAAAGYFFRDTIEKDVMEMEDYMFMEHVTKFGKSYATKTEFKIRSELFKAKLALINEWNSNPENTHLIGTNQFTDYTKEEMNKMKGYKAAERKEVRAPLGAEEIKLVGTPIDWRAKGAVNPVQNQGMCGSCWSFSATAAIEGAYFLKHGNLLKFSEQQFVDCAGSYGNYGCNGGLMDNAFDYVKAGNKLELESDYPYRAADQACKYSATKGVATVASYTDVSPGNPTALKNELANGPVSVAIEADQYVFQAYKSGVITSTQCGTRLDHGVLAVGWGTDATAGDYFIVRNSWGASWGDQGYVKIGATSKNTCGILSAASRPSE